MQGLERDVDVVFGESIDGEGEKAGLSLPLEQDLHLVKVRLGAM